jgi:hypothetical protein
MWGRLESSTFGRENCGLITIKVLRLVCLGDVEEWESFRTKITESNLFIERKMNSTMLFDNSEEEKEESGLEEEQESFLKKEQAVKKSTISVDSEGASTSSKHKIYAIQEENIQNSYHISLTKFRIFILCCLFTILILICQTYFIKSSV